MAYDNQGAAVGAAGHYASAITAALITSGEVTGVEEALETFESILNSTFTACENLKGTLPEQPAQPRSNYNRGGGQRRSNGGGGGNADPGTLDFRGGKHAGKTIADVYAEDPSYLDWCVKNMNNDFMVSRIETFLAAAA